MKGPASTAGKRCRWPSASGKGPVVPLFLALALTLCRKQHFHTQYPQEIPLVLITTPCNKYRHGRFTNEATVSVLITFPKSHDLHRAEPRSSVHTLRPQGPWPRSRETLAAGSEGIKKQEYKPFPGNTTERENVIINGMGCLWSKKYNHPF